MRSSKIKTWGLTATVAAMLTVGCGSPGPVTSTGQIATQPNRPEPLHARDTQVGAEANMMNLNASGELDTLSDEDLDSLETASDSGVMSLVAAAKKPPETKAKTLTKCGFVRSNTDGKFFLQISKGFLWWKRESSIPLSAANEAISLKIADALNKKVLVKGPQQGESIVSKKVCRLLDFGQVWDVLSKGRVEGRVYNARTLAGLAHADITIKSFATGRVWRTKSSTDGDFKVGRLDAGEYEIAAKSADYTLGAKDKISVKKRKSANVNLGLEAEAGAGKAPPPAPPVTNP